MAPPQDTGRDDAEKGDWRPGAYGFGLPVAAEKVDEVGVVALVEPGTYSTI